MGKVVWSLQVLQPTSVLGGPDVTPEEVREAFPGSVWESPPRGFYRNVVAALTAAERAGGRHRWDLDPELAEYLDAVEDVVAWVDAGAESGHVLATCSGCGEVTLRKKGAAAVGCRMTFGCGGKHEPPSRT